MFLLLQGPLRMVNAAVERWVREPASSNPVAVLLRRLAERGESAFTDQAAPPVRNAPLVVRFMRAKPRDPELKAQAEALQNWLTTHSGVFVKPDGWAGEKTSDAYRLVTGDYLPGDPRGE